MENRAHAIATGLFVLLMGLCSVLALWWFAGGGQEFRYYELESVRSVSGLNPQAAVRYRGVRVGRVLDIDLDETNNQHVIVKIRLRAEVPMTRSTRAALGTQGITGQSFVQLSDDGSDPRPLEAVDGVMPRIALSGGNIEQLMNNANLTMEKFKAASEQLNRILSNANVSRIESVLANAAASTAHLEKTLAQAPAMMADVRRFASAENADKLSGSLRDLKQATGKLTPALDSWQVTMTKFQTAAGRVEKLGGEVQAPITETLTRLNQLLGELRTTSTQLNRSLDDLQRSPQMLLLGRQPAAAGPGETTPEAP